MIKKTFTLILSFLLFVSLLPFFNTATAHENSKPSDLHKKSELNKDTIANVEKTYKPENNVNEKRKKTENQLIGNDLIFNDVVISKWNVKALKTEFIDKEEANKFKGNEVDIFGAYYTFNCIGDPEKKTACIYGGVTLSKDNQLSSPKNIGVNIFKDGALTDKSIISTDKKVVSIQELDLKARAIANNKYKIYDFYDKTIDLGYIQFHDGKENIIYDLFKFSGKHGVDFLKFYKDNKSIESENLHIDIYLYTK